MIKWFIAYYVFSMGLLVKCLININSDTKFKYVLALISNNYDSFIILNALTANSIGILVLITKLVFG